MKRLIADFFSLLARPRLKLPRVFAFPETRLDGPFAAILAQFAPGGCGYGDRAIGPFLGRDPADEGEVVVRLGLEGVEVERQAVMDGADEARPGQRPPRQVGDGRRQQFRRHTRSAVLHFDDRPGIDSAAA